MADKTGKHELIEALQRILLEYEGLKYIAEHYIQNENWRLLLSDYRSLTASKSLISTRLGAVRENLLANPVPPEIEAAIVQALDETNTL